MLSKSVLPIDVKGLTDEMAAELEKRVWEFEKDFEPTASQGGEGYVKRIMKSDFIIASVINGAILLYWLVAVPFSPR